MKLTYYAQSCFSVNIQSKVLLFEPFISPNERASPMEFIITSEGGSFYYAGDRLNNGYAVDTRVGKTKFCGFADWRQLYHGC